MDVVDPPCVRHGVHQQQQVTEQGGGASGQLLVHVLEDDSFSAPFGRRQQPELGEADDAEGSPWPRSGYGVPVAGRTNPRGKISRNPTRWEP